MRFNPIKLSLPIKNAQLLLHACCAPCSGPIIQSLLYSKIKFTLFFYNPNIYPQEEYLRRKEYISHYAEKLKISFVDADYDPQKWFTVIKGKETDSERGQRCSLCFGLRLNRTASYAHLHHYQIFATTLSISQWKDLQQVHKYGKLAAEQYSNLLFWDYNWRKSGGSQGIYEIAKRENFYLQNYCGCVYSQKSTQQ